MDFVFEGFVEVCDFSHDFDVCEEVFRQRINLWQPPLNQQVWFAAVDNQHLEILAFAKVVGFLLRLRLPLVAKRALELGVHVFENFEVIHFEAKQVFQIRQQLRKLLGTLTEVQVPKEAAWRLLFQLPRRLQNFFQIAFVLDVQFGKFLRKLGNFCLPNAFFVFSESGDNQENHEATVVFEHDLVPQEVNEMHFEFACHQS